MSETTQKILSPPVINRETKSLINCPLETEPRLFKNKQSREWSTVMNTFVKNLLNFLHQIWCVIYKHESEMGMEGCFMLTHISVV